MRHMGVRAYAEGTGNRRMRSIGQGQLTRICRIDSEMGVCKCRDSAIVRSIGTYNIPIHIPISLAVRATVLIAFKLENFVGKLTIRSMV